MRSEAWDKPAFISLPFPEGVLNTVLAACCPLPTMPLYLPSVPPPLNIPHSGAGAAGRRAAVIFQRGLILNMLRADTDDPHTHLRTGIVAQMLHNQNHNYHSTVHTENSKQSAE